MKTKIILSVVACAVLSGCGASTPTMSQAELDGIKATLEKAKRELVTVSGGESLTTGAGTADEKTVTTTTTVTGAGTVVESTVTETTTVTAANSTTRKVTENTVKTLENISSNSVIQGYAVQDFSGASTEPNENMNGIALLTSDTLTSDATKMFSSTSNTGGEPVAVAGLSSGWYDSTQIIGGNEYDIRMYTASNGEESVASPAIDLCQPTSQCGYSYFVVAPPVSNMPTSGNYIYTGGLMFGVVEEPGDSMEYGDFTMAVSFESGTAVLTSEIAYSEGGEDKSFSVDSATLTIDNATGTFSGDAGTVTDNTEIVTIDGITTYGRFGGNGAQSVIGVFSSDKVYEEDAMLNVSGSFAGEMTP